MLLSKVLSTIRRHRMLRPGDRCLVAVSGGPDSIALLYALHQLRGRLGIELLVGHLNHRLRGEESDEDEKFVVKTGQLLSLPVITDSVDMATLARASAASSRGSLEALARVERYRFLRRVADQQNANRIATAHSRDDQAETVLMKLIRGAGEEGLAGIFPVVDDLIIRPLLELERGEIERFLQQSGISFRLDSSNASPRFFRNRIRSELLPLLRRYNPAIVATLARTAEIHRRDAEIFSAWATDWIKQWKPAESGLRISVKELCRQPEGLRRHLFGSLFRMLEPGAMLPWTHRAGIERLLEAGHSGKQVELPRGWQVRREFDCLVFEKQSAASYPSFECSWSVPGELAVQGTGLRLRAWWASREEMPVVDNVTNAVVCAEKVDAQLRVRSWRPGDRYCVRRGEPLRKLKDIFQDHKIPRLARSKLPVIWSGDAIVWVPGLPVAAPFRPVESTRRVLVLEKLS